MVDHIEIRDWRAYDEAVAAGEQATRETLDKLDRRVVDLRRRPLRATGAIAGAAAEQTERAW
jgi:NTE family protein